MVAYMCIYIYTYVQYTLKKQTEQERERERESKSWPAFRSDSQTETAEEQLHGAASIGQLVEHALRKRMVVGSIPTGASSVCPSPFTSWACLLQPNFKQT